MVRYILSGEKKEEYREIKPYWTKRFYNILGTINSCEAWFSGSVIFKNGYSKNSPSIKCRVEIVKDFGKPEWGAESGKLYYVLKILSVEEIT